MQFSQINLENIAVLFCCLFKTGCYKKKSSESAILLERSSRLGPVSSESLRNLLNLEPELAKLNRLKLFFLNAALLLELVGLEVELGNLKPLNMYSSVLEGAVLGEVVLGEAVIVDVGWPTVLDGAMAVAVTSILVVSVAVEVISDVIVSTMV